MNSAYGLKESDLEKIIFIIKDLNIGTKGSILFQATMNANNFDKVYYQVFENGK